MDYKLVKKLVPWCNDCNSEILGCGNSIQPYYCKCGKLDLCRECYSMTKTIEGKCGKCKTKK